MANPTTNFGWVMPVAADLVTNLPTQFNTFGQAVDTSMAQLKGGTTGQYLTKTSGTDMAFTWATPGTWTAWTPSLVSMVQGNGTLAARYSIIGKTVNFNFKFTLGTTSTVGTSPRFTLPTTPLTINNWNFNVRFEDASTGAVNMASINALIGFPNSAILSTGNSGNIGQVTASSPFTWAVNDIIQVSGSYETT
jgi:hypothetical protein